MSQCAAKMAALHAGGPQFIAADGERDGGGGMVVAQERDPPAWRDAFKTAVFMRVKVGVKEFDAV